MDRRNGGDPLAPPRPPKLLPRVHRPRAPEPAMLSESTATITSTTYTRTTAADSAILDTPQCTNQTQLSRNNNNNLSQEQQRHHNSINSTSSTELALPPATVASRATATATIATSSLPLDNSIKYNNNNNNNNNNNTNSRHSYNSNTYNISNVEPTPSLALQHQLDDYQIHHLTFLPQRPPSLSRNNSHVSSSSSTSLNTVSNSFTRRRPPPLLVPEATTVPLLTITGNSSSNSNFLSHFHSVEPVPTSPVTLAQPRPESERLANEYVDTPLRTAQQLQTTSRTQHPAGEHNNGQTTTHHLLLLPQRELRQQQQQQQQHQHSNRLAETAGSVNVSTGIDGTDGFLHSHQQYNIHKAPVHSSPSAIMRPGKISPTNLTTPAIPSITQPITKQPASSTNYNNTCKFAKELPALDDLLDLHNIATGISTPQGIVSAVSGASPLGAPIIIAGNGSEGPSSLNPITCPQCDRCRCEQCQSPRPLPQTWVCNKTCLCSAESIIDYASCLCCAKALFYHCARDNDMDCDDGSSTPCVDNPCSCGPYKRSQRWGWLGALSLVLPCLWCYWPMRGCATIGEKCYGRFARRGCRCQQIGSTSSMLPITSPLSVNGNNVLILSNAANMQANNNATSKSVDHHSDCNANASRILRKGDLTPEKRLLDSSVEY